MADLEGKGRCIRTVAIPIWIKQGVSAWMTAAGIEDGRLLRLISKSGKIGLDAGRASADYFNGEQAAHCEVASMMLYIPVMRSLRDRAILYAAEPHVVGGAGDLAFATCSDDVT